MHWHDYDLTGSFDHDGLFFKPLWVLFEKPLFILEEHIMTHMFGFEPLIVEKILSRSHSNYLAQISIEMTGELNIVDVPIFPTYPLSGMV